MDLFVISTLSCILEYIMPITISRIITFVYSWYKDDAVMQSDLMNLKQELEGVSAVDEFSRYVKLQRKFNKLHSTLKTKQNERLLSRKKTQLYITYGFRILNGILMSALLYLYNKEPVLTLPRDTFWPIHNLLKWPGSQENTISLVMWVLIARWTISSCKKIDTS